MVDASGSFFSNKWRQHDITAIVKNRLCVSQLPWFHQRPYCLSIFRFMSTLREIWILPINSRIWKYFIMTPDKFVVSTNLYPEFGNYDYIIVCDFGGRRLSGYEVIEASEAPLGSQEAKNPVWIWTGLTHLQYRDRPYVPVHQWRSFSLRNCETFTNPWLTFRVASGPLSRFRLHPPHPTSSNFYLCSGLHSARDTV